jgi:hypothetical protein
MLIDLESGKDIQQVPFQKEYEKFMGRMTAEEVTAIKAELNSMIDGTEIQTAGWMPGSDWGNTVFEPIYSKAARKDYRAAARCFGLMVWEVFMERPEVWTSGRFEKDGEPIASRTYFQPRG